MRLWYAASYRNGFLTKHRYIFVVWLNFSGTPSTINFTLLKIEAIMFEQTFKNIDDTLRKDAGCSSELDYVEQTSWILFLKYLDDFEKDKATAAELTGKPYHTIIGKPYQWHVWAAPKLRNGKIDYHKAMTGDDLTDFVNIRLFPYLKKFKTDAESADTIEYKIGEIFSELKNRPCWIWEPIFRACGYEFTSSGNLRYPFSKANVIFKEVAKLKSAEQVAKIAAAKDHHYLIPDKGYYLGGWFEEWLFHFLKTELRLSHK